MLSLLKINLRSIETEGVKITRHIKKDNVSLLLINLCYFQVFCIYLKVKQVQTLMYEYLML